MNQSFIINDDYKFDEGLACWFCTAIFSGNRVTVYIKSNVTEGELTQEVKFDWECIIEEWLEINEPDLNNSITISAC